MRGQRRLYVWACALPIVCLLGLSQAARALDTAPSDRTILKAGKWTALASLPTPQCEAGSVVLNGKVYVMGGWKDERAPYTLTQIFDSKQNAWTSGAPLPAALHHEGVAAVDGKIYVVGGFTGPFPQREPSDRVWEFDPASGRWTAKAPLPTPRGALVVKAIDGLIYAAGGERRRAPGEPVSPPGAPAAYEPVADVTVYDPKTNVWSALPPMSVRRDHAYGGVLGGKLYVVGGRDRPKYNITTLEIFDPATKTWSAGAPMPTGRSGGNSAELDGQLFTFGGEGNAASPLGIFDQVEAYDPKSNSWTRYAPMPNPRHSTAIVSLGNRILVAGGVPKRGGDGVVDRVEAFQAN